MPKAEVYYRQNMLVPEEFLDNLGKFLPGLIAEQLSTTGTTLGPDNIELRFQPAGPRDKTIVDVGITISSGNSGERVLKLRDGGIQKIVHHLLVILPDEATFYVWVSLGESVFVQVAPRTKEEAEV
jgi:hypothetical protein